MRLVLLVVHLPTHFTELKRVADLVDRSRQFAPVFWFVRPYEGFEADADACRRRGWLVVGASDVTGGGRQRSAWRRAAGRVLRRLPPPVLAPALALARSVTRVGQRLGASRAEGRLRTQLEAARRQLREVCPDLVVLAEDNVEYGTAALIHAAHERGVKVVIVPYTIATAHEAAESYWESPEHQATGWTNRRFARRHPRWTHEHRGRTLLRLPAAEALALERLGLAPDRPWTLNSGRADRIAVESPAMHELYLREGLPAAQLAMTGALSDDRLAAGLARAVEHREALYRDAGLPPSRPMLLCALPPDQHARGRYSDFASFDELVRFWLEAVTSDPAWNVVVVPHPRLRDVARRFASPPGAALLARDTAELVPLCDLYVAAASATIRWALACGKPVVNFDVYRYGYQDYADVPEVRTLERAADFDAALREGRERSRLSPDRRRAERWGRLDGRSGERLLNLFAELSQPEPRP